MERETAETSPVASDCAILVLGRGRTISYADTAAARMFGVDADDLRGRPIASLLAAPPVATAEAKEAPEFFQASRSFSFEAWGEERSDLQYFEGCWRQLQGLGADGRPFLVEAAPKKLELGGETVFLVHLKRVSERVEGIDHLRRLQSAAAQSADSVFITDLDGVIEFVNPAFEAMTGYCREEAVGRTPALLSSAFHAGEPYAEIWTRLTAGEEYCGVFVNRRKNGGLYQEEQRIRPFIDTRGQITHFVIHGRDVSERIRALGPTAHHDTLTGLPNASLFKDRLHREFVHAARYGGGFALLYIDLDRFKAVNELYGHATGDLVLREVAAILKRCVREEDTVARMAGDEFAVILREVSHRGIVRRILEKIMKCLRFGAQIEGRSLPVSASIGACMFPDHGRDEGTLLDRADSALFGVKASGGNGYGFFDPFWEGQRSGAWSLTAY